MESCTRCNKKWGWATDGGSSDMKFFLKFYFNMEPRLNMLHNECIFQAAVMSLYKRFPDKLY